MGATQEQVLCPNCQTVVAVDPEWRLAQCPRCKGMITRMTEDSSFD